MLNLLSTFLRHLIEALKSLDDIFGDFELEKGINTFPEVLVPHDVSGVHQLVALVIEEVIFVIVEDSIYSCCVLDVISHVAMQSI